jgi:hydroxyethylthiazole kinase
VVRGNASEILALAGAAGEGLRVAPGWLLLRCCQCLRPLCNNLALACLLTGTPAGNTKGVDSTAASHEALTAAKQLATAHKCVVAVSGATDLVRAAVAGLRAYRVSVS